MSSNNLATASAPTTTGRWVLLATILASSMAFIDGSALNVALPRIQIDLSATGVDLLWIRSAYSLWVASLILVGGSLGDHLGRKRIFAIGIAIFAAASLVCGLAPTTGVLIAARAVQGVGGALMIPGSLAIISAFFPPDQRGRAIGTWSAFSTITTVLGPVIGGELASRGLWRAVFFINLPLAVIALATLYLKVPESRDETAPPQLDYLGAFLAMLGLAGITYGFIQGPELGWSIPIVLALVVGFGALIAFVVVESRSDHPMVPLRLFKSRTFSGANALTLFLYGALSGALFFLPLNLVQVQGYTEAEVGRSFLPFAILLTLLSRFAGGLADRYGPRLLLTVGPAITGLGFLILSLPGVTGGSSDYWTTYFPGIVVIGVGMGITVAPLTTAVMGSVSSSHSGTASGINNAVARTADVLATAIIGAVVLVTFNAALDTRTADLGLAPETRSALLSESVKLAGAEPPAGLPTETETVVVQRIKLAFVDTFRLAVLIGTGMAWLSALLAALIIEIKPQREAVE